MIIKIQRILCTNVCYIFLFLIEKRNLQFQTFFLSFIVTFLQYFGLFQVNRTNLKMSKQAHQDLRESSLRRKIAKSTDLKRRLFEVGLSINPNLSPNPPLGTVSSPKRLLARYPPSFGRKEEEPLLKFQPSHSPQLAKTSKDFQIRKSPKSSKSPQNITLSSFYRPDSIRGDARELKARLLQGVQQSNQMPVMGVEQGSESRLDQYVSLVLRGVEHIDQFLYLVRGSEENIYELELVQFETVREHEGETGFEYYTVSKKGFCQYVGGKPQAFLEIAEWAEEKALYLKIKALKFFFRFRRWKTLQMWRRTITKQRRQAIAHSLADRLFLLDPTARSTLLHLRRLTLDMERSVLIIAKNQGAYTLESFKHCQERARRQASLAVEEFSRESRAVVRRCFEGRLAELRENIKRKAGEEKAAVPNASSLQSPKESAFQALGFPSKMTYEHRSRLRKEAGRFLRFSYLVDSLHLSCLAGLYSGQVAAFIGRLQETQLSEGVMMRATLEEGKDEVDRERMFVLQLTCSFKDVPARLVTEGGEDHNEWSPVRDIRLKGEDRSPLAWVPRLCEHWLTLQPSLDEVLDELSFLLREGLGSLKCFQRWARHREMQKYVSILEEWDDLVSQNWEISQNDNLDPLLLLDSLDPALSRLKLILKTTENRLLDAIRNTLTDLLNAYWHYSQLPTQKLQSQELDNPAETFEHFLNYTTDLLTRVTTGLPHRIELGMITVQVSRIKTALGQRFAGVLQGLRGQLPELVEARTVVLNNWLTAYAGRLREEILNIDDFVRVVGVIREVEGEFGQRKEEYGQLAQLYQTMHSFKMDTRKKKDFDTVTFKLKEQLEQLLTTAEQNIQRKADLYTREVLKYHLPALLRDISKTLENAQNPRFLKLDSFRAGVKEDLAFLQAREGELMEQRSKCQSYMTALKIQGQPIAELTELSRQIASRVELWRTLEQWEALVQEYQSQLARALPLGLLTETVEKYRNILQRLEEVLPPNEILSFLKQAVREWYIYLPILNGFNQSLSEAHWSQIYQALPEKYPLDLKRREFTLLEFLRSGIGGFAREVQAIFQKCRVEAQLQREYQQIQDAWLGLVAKIRPQGRFLIIANGETVRMQLDRVLADLACLLSNPHAQSLKQYSITYDSLLASQDTLEGWLRVQDRIVEVEKNCRLLDIKKLPDYNFFENAERIYKQASKAMTNKGAETGVRLGKLLIPGVEEKLAEIEANLMRVEDNIKGILREHRRVFPSFYLFSDPELLRLITEQSSQALEWAAQRLNPSVARLEIENERITAIITIDQQRLIKNPISVSSEVEQILLQIGETTSQLSRRSLRSCRYKAVQNNLSSLVEQYNIQHLLAISRVDFSHYTTISIDNQQETPDSLTQFRKVMRKDTAEDIRTRQQRSNQQAIDDSKSSPSQYRSGYLLKYDTLLLQQLLYEEILDFLIRSRIQRAQEYPWASQLKFFWEDTPSDEPNITVRQLHLALKYGSEFIGSRTKVVLQSNPAALLGLRYGDCAVYGGGAYNLQRLANAVGYKVNVLACTALTSEHTLKRFLIGCHFADYIPFLLRADQLPAPLFEQLPIQKWIEDFRLTSLKRNSPYLRDIDRPHPLFLSLRDASTGWQALQSRMRIVHYQPPPKELLRCTTRLRGLYSEDRAGLLLRVFEAVGFLEERSSLQGVSLEEFLDIQLQQAEELDEQRLFERVLRYLQPRTTLETHHSLTKHIESLALLPFNPNSLTNSNPTPNNLDIAMQALQQRKVIILTGRGLSKKFFLRKQAEKGKIRFLLVSGESLERTELWGKESEDGKREPTFFEREMLSEEEKLLYFQGVTPQLLLSLESLLFASSQATTFLSSKTKIVLDIPSAEKFVTPRQLTSFPILNFESPRDYLAAAINQWMGRVKEEERKRVVGRVIFQTILPTLENLSGKDEILLEERVAGFLKHLSTLHPFRNPLQACIYALISLFRGSQEEQLKLEYLVKKHLGEEKLGQGTKIGNLFYHQTPLQDKLITQKEHLRSWIEENDSSFKDDTYVLTPSLLHHLVFARRVHDRTDLPLLLLGGPSSGKTALLALYRRIHHQNSFYLQVSPAIGAGWPAKLSCTLQRHGMTTLGARINYQQSVIIVEDLHLAERASLQPLQLMLFYGKCRSAGKEYLLKNVKFLLSAQKGPESLQKQCLRLFLELPSEGVEAIFTEFLRRQVEKQWDLNELLTQKIAISTLDVCRRVVGEGKEGWGAVRRVLSSFSKLKIKQGIPAQKEVEKFWAFALLEAVKPYDSRAELEGELKKLDLTAHNATMLSYTHLSFKPTERRIEFLRDPKRLYNLLNERIEKYNEGETKRYGDSFEFINFDSVLEKVVTISHSVLMDSDHLLVGRRGTGKEALVKLCAFFNGLFYRAVQGPIKPILLELVQASSSAPHLLYKSIPDEQARIELLEYCLCDFESEVMAAVENKGRGGGGVREKEKTVHLKSLHKGLGNSQNYIIPKAKLSSEEVISFRRAFRLVASLSDIKQLQLLPSEVLGRFHLDLMNQVPTPSLMQYNEKLLSVDGVSCTREAQTVLSEVFQHSRGPLGLSLRANDDCVRLFSSFLANLVGQMVQEEERYGKVLDLLYKLRNCNSLINAQVARLHARLKELSLAPDTSRQAKIDIETQLREKSTAQAASEKLTEILGWLEPLYGARLATIQEHLKDRNKLELTFAVTASYFIYLSSVPYERRRQHCQEWFRSVALLNGQKAPTSFLPLFLLYEEEFNAEPVDHLPEFYQNMTIIFHSAKPIAIRDRNARGRAWLEKNCSFFYLREDQKDFIQLIKDYLGRSSNILIEAADQQSLDTLTGSMLGTLLFLPESVNSVALRGEEVQIHQQAKVYLLLREGLILPKELEQEFTVVLFEESQPLAKASFTHQFSSYLQREHHLTRLDYQRKVRSLRLDCENAIGQVADSIYEQLCGNDLPPQESLLAERLVKITDKLMVRAQNQFTKIKEKEQLIRDLEEKSEKMQAKIDSLAPQQFYQLAQKIRRVLQTMATGVKGTLNNGYSYPSYAEYFSTIKLLLARGVITNNNSLMLAALRQWGPLYQPQHYTIFAFLLLMAAQQLEVQDFLALLTDEGIKSTEFLQLIGKEGLTLQGEEDLQEIIPTCLIDLFAQEEFKSIGPILSSKETPCLPLVWQVQENSDLIRVVYLRGDMESSQVKQRIAATHPKVLQPTQDDTLETLLKKTPHEEVEIIVFSKDALKEADRVIRAWSLVDKAVLFYHDTAPSQPLPKQIWWEVQLTNTQTIFSKVIDFYHKSVHPPEPQELKEEPMTPAVEAPLLFTGFSAIHVHPEFEYSNDNLLKMVEQLVQCVRWKHQSLCLPVPQWKRKELVAMRKSVDNSDNPLTLSQKINFLFQPLFALLRPPSHEVTAYLKTLQAKLIRLSTESFSEEEFYKDASSALAQGGQAGEGKEEAEVRGLRMELGWLVSTRRFFGLERGEWVGRYLREVEECITSCLIYSEAPKVTRGAKRQPNIKKNRQSQPTKKGSGRESQSVGKRSLLTKAPIVRLANSPLASLYLLKESESYQQALYKIHVQLQQAKSELQKVETVAPSEKTLRILASVLQNQPIPSWKAVLAEVGCASGSLDLVVRTAIARRNQVYTYYNKFSISESCELDFKFIRQPAQFLRAYFRSELTPADSFMLATTLTSEEAERGEYLRVNGMWGLGWRLTPEGLFEGVGESKPVQLAGCFIVKKTAVGVAVNAVELLAAPEAPEPLMRLFAMSKKSQTVPLKLYLRCD